MTDIKESILRDSKIKRLPVIGTQAKIQRRTMTGDRCRFSQIGCKTCHCKLNRNFQSIYRKRSRENLISFSVKSKKSIEKKAEENLPLSSRSTQPAEECNKLSRTKKLILMFNEKAKRPSNDEHRRKLGPQTKVS